MQVFQLAIVLLFMTFQPGHSAKEFKIIQYWNGVASEDKKTTLAVKANGEIDECIWTNDDTDKEYEDGKKKDDVKVTITKDGKDKKKTLCKLEISKVKEDDHAGEWSVEVVGKCREDLTNNRGRNRASFRTIKATDRSGRKRRQTNSSIISNIRSPISQTFINPLSAISPRHASVSFQASRKKKSNCNAEIDGIKLEVTTDRKALILLPAMEGDNLEDIFDQDDAAWAIKDGKKATLSTRANQFPDECIVSFDRDEIVKVEKKNKKNDEECKKHEKAKVCVSKYEDKKAGIFACQVEIEDFNDDLEGTWEVEVSAGKETESVEFEVALDESSGGEDCEVDEGDPTLANVSGEDLTVCTEDFEEKDEFTLEVEFESNPKPKKVEWEMRRKVKKQKKVKVAAGKKKSGFDAEDFEEDDDVPDRYLAAITFKLEEEDWDEEENFLLKVENKEGKSEFLITLDQSSRCDPSQEIGEGECGSSRSVGDYECDVDDDRDCRCIDGEDECCDASRRCKKNCCKKCTKDEKDDDECEFCNQDGKKCMIAEDDDDGGGDYDCDTEDDKDCRCDDRGKQCCDASKKCKKNCCEKCTKEDKKDDDICNMCDDGGRKCMKLDDSASLSGPYGKAVKVMVESCVELGGTLLEQFSPDGDKKGSKSEREFKKDMEDFFETAKCTRFDDDIQDYYEDNKGKKKKGSLRSQSSNTGGTVSFQNLAFKNKVSKVSTVPQDGPLSLTEILGLASKVTKNADIIEG